MDHFNGCTFRPELPEGADIREQKILLHCCCAPCSTAILEWMVAEDLRPGVFFSNSNIVPYDEYMKRRDELGRYAASFGLEVVDDEYDHGAWLEHVISSAGTALAGPERGPRCLACFEFRLLRAAKYAASHGYDVLTTTLASSRWKDLSQVDAAGQLAVASVDTLVPEKTWKAGIRRPAGAGLCESKVVEPERPQGVWGRPNPQLKWWGQNWRKGGMQERRNFLVKSRALYNQTWCGCEFSQRKEVYCSPSI
ncbi:MAG: epoxyqueuosine reductase QueH [Bacteroidales bacterium]|nr:epoxyqueuosine reductase QueH [Bacteroidales bacterium]